MRFDATTPIMAAEMTWVVESGMPMREASSITVAAAVSAAKPLMGLIWASLVPSVLMILQPPTAVPSAIAIAQVRITHEGISKAGK